MINDTLGAAIEAYDIARKEFRELCAKALTDEAFDKAVDELWEVADAADLAVLRFPCRSAEDIEAKVRFYLADENAFDTIQNGIVDSEDALTVFLQSLVPTATGAELEQEGGDA